MLELETTRPAVAISANTSRRPSGSENVRTAGAAAATVVASPSSPGPPTTSSEASGSPAATAAKLSTGQRLAATPPPGASTTRGLPPAALHQRPAIPVPHAGGDPGFRKAASQRVEEGRHHQEVPDVVVAQHED